MVWSCVTMANVMPLSRYSRKGLFTSYARGRLKRRVRRFRSPTTLLSGTWFDTVCREQRLGRRAPQESDECSGTLG